MMSSSMQSRRPINVQRRQMCNRSMAPHSSVRRGRFGQRHSCQAAAAAGATAGNSYSLLEVGNVMYFATAEDYVVGSFDCIDSDFNYAVESFDTELKLCDMDPGKGAEGPKKRKGGPVAAEIMPVCLIKPVAGEAATITNEELEAKATWGVRAVKATGSNLTGAGVKVAVLDTGLDRHYHDHPAFQGVEVYAKNFTTDQSRATHDTDGHGTHCLGTILGRPVDGVRIGVAPGITDVLVAKVVPDRANGTSFMLVKALLWAWEEGANIINISLAYDLVSKTQQLLMQNKSEREAVDTVQHILADNLKCLERVMALLQEGQAVRPPPLVIAACGNGSSATSKVHVYLPASVPGVLSVAAAAKSPEGLKVAAFSNVGAKLCAPGFAVCSAAAAAGSTGSGAPLLKVLNGTSMAAPHVTGVAALWWEQARLEGVPEDDIAEMVAEKLGAFATRKGFVPGVDAAAVGRGLVQAPAE